MSLSAYTFTSSDAITGASLSGFAPFTIVFQPSAINFGNTAVGRITYAVSGINYELDNSVTREFTYSSLNEALTGSTRDIDSRSNYTYTLYNTISGRSITDITVNVMVFPPVGYHTYNLRIYTDTPYLTRNPLDANPAPYVFDSVHLLKSRSWGVDNNQILVLEGSNSPGQFITLNTSDSTELPRPPRATPAPSPSPTPTPTSTATPSITPSITVSITPTVTPSVSLTPTPTPTPIPAQFYYNIPLTYSFNGDTNGLFYYIGTNALNNSFTSPGEITTPQSSKTMVVTAFDPAHAGSPLTATTFYLTDRNNATEIDTGPGGTGIDACVIFNLRRKIKVNKYSIRTGNSPGWIPRNWKLQGSTDALTWTDLKDHVNDTTLTTASTISAWDVADTGVYYSYLKIQNTGINSSLNYELYMSGVEFYGDLKSADVSIHGTSSTTQIANLSGAFLSNSGAADVGNALAYSVDNTTWTAFTTYETISAGFARPIYIRTEIGGTPNQKSVATINDSTFYNGITATDGLYTVHTFNSSGILYLNSSKAVSALIIGGGGGGCLGGGGAGGVIFNTQTLSAGLHQFVVGGGGSGMTVNLTTARGRDGGNTIAFGSLTAFGGGAGGNTTNSLQFNGTNGGSGGGGGGGSGGTTLGGAPTSSQGMSGGGNGGFTGSPYAGGGGGGYSTVGQTMSAVAIAGQGGAGYLSAITGTPTYYAGGGGGSAYLTCTPGAGGNGGGGAGTNGANGTAGTANTGGGGGGANDSFRGGHGGNGVVIIRYLT